MCIAIGLALGAEQPLLAIALAGVSTVFIVGMSFSVRKQRQQRLLLTITGDSKIHFSGDEQSVLSAIETIAGNYTLQRFDLENGRGQVRIVLDESKPRQTAEIVTRLQERLPDCEISYVNLNSTL